MRRIGARVENVCSTRRGVSRELAKKRGSAKVLSISILSVYTYAYMRARACMYATGFFTGSEKFYESASERWEFTAA